MEIKNQASKLIQVKILSFLFCIVSLITSCLNVKQSSKRESIIDKNKLVSIDELYGASKIDDYKEIIRIDSITSIVADTTIGVKKKYEIIYYLFNRTYGVVYWEVIRFDDMMGAKASYCHMNKKIKQILFEPQHLKTFLDDKEIFTGKLSYNASYVKGYRKYLIFKENNKIIFCDILVTSSPDENFKSNSFINNYLKIAEESCK
ncbi:hypothetical protein BH10BAC1_BH10BAC1_16120 [soil metagenome]